MRALVYHGPRDLRIEEVGEPEPAPGEVLVRVHGCGICGSDLHGYLGHSSARVPPLVLGHEVAGVVDRIGEGVDPELEGRAVCVRPTLVCGSCERCEEGRDNLCAERRLMGLNAPGGLAERVAVPVGNLVTLPGDQPVDAAIVEVLANAIHVVGLAGERGSIAVAGGGCLGLLTVMVAARNGIEVRLLTEPSERRRGIALGLGATAVADGTGTTLRELAAESVPGGVDVAVDAVGLTQTRDDAIRAVRPGGRVVLLGLEQESSEIDVADVIRREVELVGSFAYTSAEFAAAAALYLEEAESLATLVTAEPLSRGAEVFAGLADREDFRVKVVLTP